MRARTTTSRTGARRFNAGFTFLELIIVLLILGMTTTAVLPRFRQSFASMSFHQAQSQLVNYLWYARHRAIARRQQVQFAVLRDDALGYQLLAQPTGTTAWEPIAGRLSRRRTLPDAMALELVHPDGRHDETETITFYPNGFAEAARIVLSTAAGLTSTVQVDDATGNITVAPADDDE